MVDHTRQLFGGDWTQEKLAILEKYLHFYTTALRPTGLRLIYIDAFAGTGYRELRSEDTPEEPLFPELADEEPQRFLAGSARIALESTPKFHDYVFIERSQNRVRELDSLRVEEEFDWARDKIDIRCGDSNEIIRDVCAEKDWNRTRAVLFLDPFGLQVEWKTLEVVAQTRSIDVWILFPLSVNRLLTKDGRMPTGWNDRLFKLFGTSEWTHHFYQKTTEDGLFGREERTEKNVNIDGIIQFWQARLSTIFAAVAEKPKRLENSRGTPLFAFCFAVSNYRAKDLAMKAANHILDS